MISAPAAPSQRIISLDVLRGIAILGILIMNIQSFSMIQAAYMNPSAYGDFSGANRIVWILSHIFADQKFMTIFAVLFGAGIVLIASKAEAKGISPIGIHYRRTFWLIIIGLLHAYLLWYGDILFSYGICALFAFWFRKFPPLVLLIAGLLMVMTVTGFYIIFDWSYQFWPEESVEQSLTGWAPDAEAVREEVEAYQGSWADQMKNRAVTAFMTQTIVFMFFLGWRAGGLMLVGMALIKWGILTAERSTRFYILGAIGGLALGMPVIVWGIERNMAAEWAMKYSMFMGMQFNYWGSLFMAGAYICLVMLLCRYFSGSRFIHAMAAVGRTALSNYLLQTVICTFIFYGHGLGLFGTVQRIHQIFIVAGVWIILVFFTLIWLKFFRFGPFEWLWRSLTYMKLQPLRKSPPEFPAS